MINWFMKKKLIENVRYLIAILLVASIAVFLLKNKDKLELLYNINFMYCFLLLPCVFLTHLVGSANLFVLLKAKHQKLVWIKWIGFHLVKRFMNMHLPQSGNVYEAIKMKEKFGIDTFCYVSSFGAVNWFNACLNCFISFVLLLGWSGGGGQKNMFVIGGLLLLLIILIVVPLSLDFLFLHARKCSFPGTFDRYVATAHQLVRSMREDIMDVRIFPRLLLWNILLFCVSTVSLFLGFRTLDVHVELNVLIPFVALNSMVALVSILPSNIGITEYAFGFLGDALNLAMTIGILLSLLFRLLTYVVFLATYFLTTIKLR